MEVDGNIILGLIMEKYVGVTWTRFICLGIGTSVNMVVNFLVP
jgi:hypothetical protein